MHLEQIISGIGLGIEALGVLVMLLGFVWASLRFAQNAQQADAYAQYRQRLGRSIILGLEFLIAGDIIRTVVVENTLQSITMLGLIVLIRTFLSITLHLEVEGRWPWQAARNE